MLRVDFFNLNSKYPRKWIVQQNLCSQKYLVQFMKIKLPISWHCHFKHNAKMRQKRTICESFIKKPTFGTFYCGTMTILMLNYINIYLINVRNNLVYLWVWWALVAAGNRSCPCLSAPWLGIRKDDILWTVCKNTYVLIGILFRNYPSYKSRHHIDPINIYVVFIYIHILNNYHLLSLFTNNMDYVSIFR